MTVLSILRGTMVPAARKVLSQNTVSQARHMSDHRLMNITASRFQWNKFKDMLHLYMVGAGAPLLLGVFLVNVLVGPGSLTEPPPVEEYAPEEWEYYKSPITRFLSRYVTPNPQQEYEKKMHFLWEIEHKRQLRFIEAKVRKKMAERGDYKAWYYVPDISRKYQRIVKKETEELFERRPAA